MNIATLKSEPALRNEAGLERAILCARSAEENKAKDVVVLDMRGITPLYDFQVLATGASRRQIHTLAEEIDAAMAAAGEKRLSIEGYQAGRWVVHAGRYEAVVYYTCAASDVGSTVELSLGEARIETKVTQAHDPPLYGKGTAEHDGSHLRPSLRDHKIFLAPFPGTEVLGCFHFSRQDNPCHRL